MKLLLTSFVFALFVFGSVAFATDKPNNRAALDRPLREQFHRHPSFIGLLKDSGYLTHQSGKWWEGSFQDGGFTHGMTHGDPERGGLRCFATPLRLAVE